MTPFVTQNNKLCVCAQLGKRAGLNKYDVLRETAGDNNREVSVRHVGGGEEKWWR